MALPIKERFLWELGTFSQPEKLTGQESAQGYSMRDKPGEARREHLALGSQ